MPVVDPCCIPIYTGAPCGQPSHPVAPFAICGRHARQVWERFNQFADSVRSNEISQLAVMLNEHDAVRRRSTRELAESQTGLVYYVQIGDNLKIGYTKNLPQRLAAYPPTRRLLATERGGWDRESQRLREFRHLLDAGNEWFHPGPDLIEHINELRRAVGSSPIDLAA